MITVVLKWDKGWFQPKSEAFIVRQVCEAFDVDRLIFTPIFNIDIPKIEQMETVSDAIASAQGEPIFLEPTGEKTLNDIPDGDVILILGNTCSHNLDVSKPEQRYRFKMAKPEHKGVFAVSSLAIVLAHRFGQ